MKIVSWIYHLDRMKYTRYEQSTSGDVNFLIIIIFISSFSISSLFTYLIILLIHF